jgi:hypothetical protein
MNITHEINTIFNDSGGRLMMTVSSFDCGIFIRTQGFCMCNSIDLILSFSIHENPVNIMNGSYVRKILIHDGYNVHS